MAEVIYQDYLWIEHLFDMGGTTLNVVGDAFCAIFSTTVKNAFQRGFFIKFYMCEYLGKTRTKILLHSFCSVDSSDITSVSAEA